MAGVLEDRSDKMADRLLRGHFGDESFQAINCTGTDNQKQSNTTLHTPETQKRNRKNCPS